MGTPQGDWRKHSPELNIPSVEEVHELQEAMRQQHRAPSLLARVKSAIKGATTQLRSRAVPDRERN